MKYLDVIRRKICYYVREKSKKETNVKEIPQMLVCDYIVESIDGDYANLRRVDKPEEELKLVARALLPENIVEGGRLHYEMLQYTIV